jgi:23S rRNA (pseudouridine1915-N3)-methyltransferase
VRLTFLCVGGVKGPVASVIRDYEERIRRYWRLRTVEVEAGLGKRAKVSATGVLEAERERLLGQLQEAGEVVAMTREGKSLSSRQLSDFLQERALRSVPDITFVIGGAFGLEEEVLRRSSVNLSLSTLTLPHELARLILAEQVYRAGTISRNEPYHKGP